METMPICVASLSNEIIYDLVYEIMYDDIHDDIYDNTYDDTYYKYDDVCVNNDLCIDNYLPNTLITMGSEGDVKPVEEELYFMNNKDDDEPYCDEPYCDDVLEEDYTELKEKHEHKKFYKKKK